MRHKDDAGLDRLERCWWSVIIRKGEAYETNDDSTGGRRTAC